MTPSVPSFCTPGSPESALLVMSFHSPFLRISAPVSRTVRTSAPAASRTSQVTGSSGRILRSGWSTRRTPPRALWGEAPRLEPHEVRARGAPAGEREVALLDAEDAVEPLRVHHH